MHTNIAGQDYGPVGFAARGNRLFALHQHQIISTAGSRGRRAVVRLPLAKAADPISTALSRVERNTACGRAVSPRAARSLSGRPWRSQVQARLSGVGFPPRFVSMSSRQSRVTEVTCAFATSPEAKASEQLFLFCPLGRDSLSLKATLCRCPDLHKTSLYFHLSVPLIRF